MTKTLKIFSLAVALFVAIPAAQALAAPHAKAKAQFSRSAYGVAENSDSGSVALTVVRPQSGHSKARLAQGMTVDYSTFDGTAKAGTDYTGRNGTLSFPACGSSIAAHDPCVEQTITVAITNNDVIDGARAFTVKLSNPTSTFKAVLGFPSVATVVIADDDSLPGSGSTVQLVNTSNLVQEPQTTGISDTEYVVRSGDLTQPASVAYATQDGTAVAGTDYTATSGTATFGVGEVLQSVDIPLLHNASQVPERDFSLNLSLPSGSPDTLGSPSSEDITIVNSDGPVTLFWLPSTYSVAENSNDPVTMTVAASGAITGSDEADVDYKTIDGSAIAGVNYVAQSDTLQFFAGDFAESFDVPVLDDGQPGDKFFTAGLTMDSQTVIGAVGNPSTATVNVLNVDAANNNGTGSTGSTTGNTSTGGGSQGSQLVLGARSAACGLTVKTAKKQKLLKKKALVLTLRSTQPCKVGIGAIVSQLAKHRKAGHSARAIRFKGKNVSLSLQPNKAKTVKVKFAKKTLKAIQKALRARKRLVATVVVTARTGTAPAGKRTLKITIKR